MYLPQQFENDYAGRLVILSCFKLIHSKDTLPDVVKFFYKDYFDKIDQERLYPDIYRYIETKSNDFFQNVGISFYENSDCYITCLHFSENAYQYVFYEYYLSTLNRLEYSSDDTISQKIDNELNSEFLDLLDGSILHTQMKYGEAEYESPFILEIDLVKLILFLSEIDCLITERMTLEPLKELT